MKGINYVGSTNNIKKRCWKHKNACWDENKRAYNYPLYQHIRKKNIDIELEILGVYKRKCSKRIKLLVEQYYIDKYDSVNNGLNSYNAFGVDKKKEKQHQKIYYEKNKEKMKKRTKKYYKKNKEKKKQKQKEYKDKKKEKQKEKILCDCGCMIRRDSLSKHLKTKKHLKCIDVKTSNE